MVVLTAVVVRVGIGGQQPLARLQGASSLPPGPLHSGWPECSGAEVDVQEPGPGVARWGVGQPPRVLGPHSWKGE